MHFIDQIDFVATTRWRVLHVVEQLTHIVNTSARGSIHFNQINKPSFVDLIAGRALTTGNRANTGFAVETLGENSRDGGFAHTPGASEQVGVVQAIMIKGIDQCLQHVLLACHFGKNSWAPFTGKDLVTHSSDDLRFKKPL